jgi:chemotaxis protein methyltransferase CheR
MSAGLQQVATVLEEGTGIVVKEPQLGALEAALGRVAPGMDADRFLVDLQNPDRRAALLRCLVDEVAIQETFFLREQRELEAIDWHRLLAAAHASGAAEVTVWVAACASGEEAYSIAMLASEAFGGGRAPVAILATDISARALSRAQAGAYSERSARALDPDRRERFFVADGSRTVVGEQLRSLVRFRRHNLVADPSPPVGEVSFDLILCRNVLIYFSPPTVEAVVRSLESALRPGGQLILGAADRLSSSAQRLADSAAARAQPARATAPPRRRARALRRPRERKPQACAKPPRAAAARSQPVVVAEDLGEALVAANEGRLADALEITARALRDDPLDAEAYFVRGLAQLADGDPAAAADSLRRALYVDPTFALAAFELGRAHDLRGDPRAAERAYAQTLRVLDPEDDRHLHLLDQVNVGDIAAACRSRIGPRRG